MSCAARTGAARCRSTTRRSRRETRPTRRPRCASCGAASRLRSRSCTPTEREALELAYYGGLSQSEIAERLGVPLGTVKSRMFAGLARLRDLLGARASVVLPLFDNIPSRRFAVVTYALIAANVAVFALGARRPRRAGSTTTRSIRAPSAARASGRPRPPPVARGRAHRRCSCTRAGCTCSGTCSSSGSSATTSRT